ncbi:TetR/AcrR family transcriptional regulator [Sphingopyxis granuli]|nr:TetR/AcrR family transcriptional regulator [Sphingopyxis granuli]
MEMKITILGDRDTAAGRPRQAELDERIKASAVAILGEFGFAGLSINRVCRHAGVPRPTFYRRWPSAMAALVDAFNDRFDDALLTDTGDVAADLLAFATAVRNRYDDPVVATCLPAIYEARRVAPDLIAPIADAQRMRRKANVAILTRALAAQDIHPVLPPFEIIFTLAAAIDQGYLAGRPLGDDFLQRLVIALLR